MNATESTSTGFVLALRTMHLAPVFANPIPVVKIVAA
jgi:hypothetical protein